MVRACIGDRNHLINLLKSGEAVNGLIRAMPSKENMGVRMKRGLEFHKVPNKDEKVSRPAEDEHQATNSHSTQHYVNSHAG